MNRPALGCDAGGRRARSRDPREDKLVPELRDAVGKCDHRAMDELATCPKCGAITRTDPCTRCGAELSDTSGMLSVSVPDLALDGDPQVATPPRAAVPQPMQRGQAAAYLVLQPSETAVLHAASRVMAGFIANGEVSADNENDQADRAVRIATRMALVIEKYIQSDNEDW